MADYDKYYTTENLFGEPYAELVSFFKSYEPKGKLIDVGCGQGRDAIALAKQGYEITAIDNSKVGIDQLNTIAKDEKLNINAIVEDIFKYDSFDEFDVVLLDSMFHFEKRDLLRETNFIIKIAIDIKQNAIICFCIQDTGSKVKVLKQIFENIPPKFDIINDSSLIYKYEDKASNHKSETKYNMFIVKKL